MTRSDTRLPAYAWGSEQKVATHPVAQLKQQDNPDEKPLQMTHRSLSPRTHPFHTIYDFAGRLIQGQSGFEANGRTDVFVETPFRNNFSYTSFGETTNITGKHWPQTITPFAPSINYATGRITTTSGDRYDAAGNMTSERIDTVQPINRTMKYDAAGRTVERYDPLVHTCCENNHTYTNSYDGNGALVKSVNVSSPPSGTPNTEFKYEIRSTVLGGETVGELKTFDWSSIVQQRFIVPINGVKMGARVESTAPEGIRSYGEDGAELDPRGSDIGTENPYATGGDGGGGYPETGGDPTNFWRCTWEGMPISCGQAAKMAIWMNHRINVNKSIVRDSPINYPGSSGGDQGTVAMAAHGPTDRANGESGSMVSLASMPTGECPPGRTCSLDEEGREYYIDEDGTTVYPNLENVGTTRAFDLFNIKSPGRSPTAGFMGPMPAPPPGLSPGLQPPVTMPEPGAGPGWGRVIFTRALIQGGRTAAVGLLAPTIVILLLPTTANAPTPLPTGQTTTTTTTTEEDDDPFVGVYRVAGGSSEINGPWWTPVDPRSVPNYRGAAALPPTNTGETLVIGSVRNSNIIHRGTAAPQPQWGHQGGAIEYKVIPGSVIIHGTLPLIPRL